MNLVKGLKRRYSLISTRINYFFKKRKMPYIAPPDKFIHVHPRDIISATSDKKLKMKYPQGSILKLDQYISPREEGRSKIKSDSIKRHFIDGVAWEETDLFKISYQGRLDKGETVRGCTSISELVKKYQIYNSIFESMKKEGFLTDHQKGIDPVYVHIYADGKIMMGKNGNHRLAIAELIGLNAVPVKVWSRDFQWNEIRKEAWENPRALKERYPHFIDHPDLKDILSSRE